MRGLVLPSSVRPMRLNDYASCCAALTWRSDVDAEIERIKDVHYANLRTRRVVMIEQSDYGYRVHQWSPDGVAPQSDYDTPNEAAARAMQLLGIKEPVTPQDWPEQVQVGMSK